MLLEGVPGLAKTLTVKTLADVLGGSFRRVQFTPDLVPVRPRRHARLPPGHAAAFETELGPVFGNFLLADEINRAPAKVQSALLEVMQEHQVTIGGETHPRAVAVPGARDAEPDRVRGHLPAARGAGRPLPVQAARRLPDVEDEAAVVERAIGPPPRVRERLAIDDLERYRAAAQRVFVDRDVIGYAVALADATRHPDRYGLHDLAPLIEYGASPRGPIGLSRPRRRSRCCAAARHVVAEDVARPRRATCCATGSCSPTTRSATACARRRARAGARARSAAARAAPEAVAA